MLSKIFFFFLFIQLFFKTPVFGQNNNGYSITPPFSNLEIGSDVKQQVLEIQIKNNTKEVVTYDLSVVDFGTLDESGGVAFLTSKPDSNVRKYALASWVSLEKDSVVIEPNKSEKLKVTILNKDSLSAGGHYGAVLATLRHDGTGTGSIVGVNQILASLMYIQKTGGEKKVLMLNKVDVGNNLWKISEKTVLRFENSGNTHLVPRGYINIQSKTGQLVARGIINTESSIIIPESFRKYTVVITNYGRWLWPGKYVLEINYRYDGKSSFETQRLSILYFGKEGIVLTVLGVLVVSLVLWKLVWKDR